MKYSVKTLVNELSPKDLLSLCNEKMLCAARDLAEFTKYGLNANFIVSLAHKCEEYEKIISQPGRDHRDYSRLETELKEALEKICKYGRNIRLNMIITSSIDHFMAKRGTTLPDITFYFE